MFTKNQTPIFLKNAAKVIIILITGILLGFLALCLVHLLPTERMFQNVLHSQDVINSHAQLIPGYESTTIDNYTDSIMLNEAICPFEGSLIEKVIYNNQVNYYRQYDQQENLLRYLQGEEGYDYQGYSHYWGGHQVFLKLLLLWFDYADILVINVIAQGLLLVLVIMGLYKAGKQHIILPFLAAVLSMMPIVTAICLQYNDIYYITMLGSCLIVFSFDKIKASRMYLLFLVLGMATSYFDFLTYPFVSLGIPLVLFLVFISAETFSRQLFYLIQCSALWCIGYLGMWSGKWILSGILMPGKDMIGRALISIRYRSSSFAGGKAINVFDVLLKNLFVYLKWPIIFLIGGTGIYLPIRAAKRKAFSRALLLKCVCYLLICLYPIAWYLIAKNHSYEHSFMTYRELAITTFSGLAMLAEAGHTK